MLLDGVDSSFGAAVSAGGGVPGGSRSQQPLMPKLRCGERRLLLMWPRASRAARKTAARQGGPGVRQQRCQAWVREPGEGAGRRCLPAPSAGTGLGSTADTLHSPRTHVLPWGSRLCRGTPPAHPLPRSPAQGQGAVQGPSLALPSCRAGQARRCSSAQGKGWRAPYCRPRWEPILTPSRVPAAPQR